MYKPTHFDQQDFPEEVFEWLGGDRSERVEASVQAWLRESPHHQTTLDELHQIWNSTATAYTSDNWAALNDKIDEIERRKTALAPELTFQLPEPRQSYSFAVRAAAVLLIAAAGAFIIPWVGHRIAPTEMARIVVPAGGQTEITLSGGVKVRLSYTTELEYIPGPRIGEVFLRGEAYFSVPNGAKHNFVVRTDAGTVKDLGTEFNVRSRGGETAVLVSKGVVELRTEVGQVTLSAGQRSSARLGSAPTTPSAGDIEQTLGWMSRRLTFYDESIAEIAQEMEYRYGLPFEVKDSTLRSTRITAQLSSDAGAKDAAEAICIAVQARCTRGADRWIISPR